MTQEGSPSRYVIGSQPRDRSEPAYFANLVNSHASVTAHESLYPGPNYNALSRLLQQPSQKYPTPPPTNIRKDLEGFASLLHLRDQKPRIQYLKCPEEISSDAEDHRHCHDRPPKARGTLLHLRGYARPEWLNAVGLRYSLDPQFILDHLQLFYKFAPSNYFTSRSSPSALNQTVRLCVTTIGSLGSHGTGSSGISKHEIPSVRSQAEASLRKHIMSISNGSENEVVLGDSMVRQFSVHDEDHFSLEQEISIYVTGSNNHWTALVWSDIGNDLSESQIGPWHDKLFNVDPGNISYIPTIQNIPRQALRQTPGIKSSAEDEIAEYGASIQHSRPNKILQSASRLHLGFMEREDSATMVANSLHALRDIFYLASSSELQFLNLIESKLRKELDYAFLDQQQEKDVTNFLYHKQILKRHMGYYAHILAFIEITAHTNWPEGANVDIRGKADEASQDLSRRFQCLFERNEALIKECNDGMTARMTTLQIKEAQGAQEQARVTAKLTRLAFFFIPLSFTTSFYGMNVRELGSNTTTRVWQWVLMSIIVLGVSLAFLSLRWLESWHGLHFMVTNKIWKWLRGQRNIGGSQHTKRFQTGDEMT